MTGFALTPPNGNNADLTLFQGKTINIPLIWGGSTPINVTGYDARLCVKANYSDASALFEFTVANSRVSIGTTDGLITFTMSATDSAALTAPFSGLYEIEVEDAVGTVHRAMYGKLKVDPEVCS